MSEGLDFADNNARAVITVRNRFVKNFKISGLFYIQSDLYATATLGKVETGRCREVVGQRRSQGLFSALLPSQGKSPGNEVRGRGVI